MLESDHFIWTAEQHFVITHDAAATHGADTDLLRVALLTDGGTIIHIVIFAIILLVDGISQHQCSAAGSIQLVVVVLFHDLNVVIRAQNRRSALAQLRQHIDAHGHVRAFEYRNGAGQLHHLELQLFRKAGSAYHNGQLVGLAVGQSLFYGRRGAEIDDHIALAVQLFQTVVHGDTVLIAVLQVDAGDHAAVLTLCDHITQHMAHTAANALNHNICHSFYPFLPALHIGISQNARTERSAGHFAAKKLIP